MKSKLQGNIMLLICALIWGSAFVAQSFSRSLVGPFTFLFARSVIGTVVLLPVIAFFGGRKKKAGTYRPLSTADKKRLLLGGLLCGAALFAASAFQQAGIFIDASAGDAGFITALYVLIVPLLRLMLGQKASGRVWLGVLLALLGLYFLTDRLVGFTTGNLLVLACAFLFSVQILLVDYFAPKMDGLHLSFMQFAVEALLAFFAMLLFETPSLSAICNAYLPILYTGVLSSGVAYTLQILGQMRTDPTAASLIMSLESVFALLFGMLLQPEENPVKVLKLFGCLLIFTAIVLAQLPERRRRT